MPTAPVPHLTWDHLPRSARSAVLVLPGGTVASDAPMSQWDLGALRMVPFARALSRSADGDVAVARLRYRVRGWNDGDPLRDARWALDRMREQIAGPFAVVGHSMGGRVALNLTREEGVHTAALLAPWIAPWDPTAGGPHLRALLIHGRLDFITNAELTREFAERLRESGSEVQLELIPWELHAMARRARHWHSRVAGFVTESLRRPPG